MSKATDYYPMGAYNDPSAPYNQSDPESMEFEVTCSQSLSKTTTVITNNYIPGSSGVDYEIDDEGRPYATAWHDDPDTSDTNWVDEYHDNDHYTPIQLIELLKDYIEKDLIYGDSKYSKQHLEHLLKECDGWTEDETEIFED